MHLRVASGGKRLCTVAAAFAELVRSRRACSHSLLITKRAYMYRKSSLLPLGRFLYPFSLLTG